MEKIFAIALKDTKLRFTGITEWLFFLILPIFFTFILAGGTGASPDNRVRLTVVDLAHSDLSQELLTALDKSEAVHPEVSQLAAATGSRKSNTRRPASEPGESTARPASPALTGGS